MERLLRHGSLAKRRPYFSTMVFISMPPHDWQPKEGWKYWVVLEGVLGWLLLALFLVTLGNVMIR